MSKSKKKPSRRGQPAADPEVGVRTERVMVRLSPEEKKAWQAQARDDGRKLGDWIRRTVEVYCR